MRMAIGVAFAILASVGGAAAQAPTITVADTELRLGMSQVEVRAELAKQISLFMNKDGSVENEPESDSGKPDYEARLRFLTFNHRRLSRVEKYWRPDDSPDTALVIANALYGATLSVAGSYGKVCRVHAWTRTEPDQDYKDTTIECDVPGASRSVDVFVKTFHFGDKEDHSVQVNETLEVR